MPLMYGCFFLFQSGSNSSGLHTKNAAVSINVREIFIVIKTFVKRDSFTVNINFKLKLRIFRLTIYRYLYHSTSSVNLSWHVARYSTLGSGVPSQIL